MNSTACKTNAWICTILQHTSSVARQVFTRRSLARLLSTFICSAIIAFRPFSRFGGQYAFLVLALKELVFSVQENLAQQLELTCLNILGALIGIGLSTLAKYLASLAGPDTVAARTICALFLILISFVGEHLCLETLSRWSEIDRPSFNEPSRDCKEQACPTPVVDPDILLRICMAIVQ